jgi:integrase
MTQQQITRSNEELVKQWLQLYSKSSEYSYRASYLYMTDVLVDIQFANLTAQDIEKVQAKLITAAEAGKQKNGKNPVRTISIGIRSLLRFLFEQEIVTTDFSSLITIEHPNPAKTKGKYTIEYRFVNVCWGLTSLPEHHRMFVWLVAFVGLAVTDVLELTWSNVSLERHTLSIEGKDGRVTEIQLDPALWKHLLNLKQPESYLFDPIFVRSSRASYKKVLDRTLKQLGVEEGVKGLSNSSRKVILTPVFALP